MIYGICLVSADGEKNLRLADGLSAPPHDMQLNRSIRFLTSSPRLSSSLRLVQLIKLQSQKRVAANSKMVTVAPICGENMFWE